VITDLCGTGSTHRSADVVVVGAGTVGLAISTLLARNNLSVVCLESGGAQQEEEEHPLNRTLYTGSVYLGATKGRYRCLGGTSTRWGGSLIPFIASDMEQANWPIRLSDLEPFVASVEALFGLEPGPYEGQFPIALPETHIARFAKWPRFRNRNVYNILKAECHRRANLHIITHATVTELEVNNQYLRNLQALAPDGSKITIQAKSYIVAAGAIETTRLILLADLRTNGAISSISPCLGRYFSDHISAKIAQIEPRSIARLNRLVGFRFGKYGTMRHLRFELSNTSNLRKEVPPCFAHVKFETSATRGFETVRKVLQRIQSRRPPSLTEFVDLAASLPWISRAAFSRVFEKRLLNPDGASAAVHMVVEQEANAENCIRLSTTHRDQFGVPLPVIQWAISDKDLSNFRKAAAAFEAIWRNSRLNEVARYIPLPERQVEEDLSSGGGIYHPCGSTRMANSSRDGVVDPDLKLFGIPNVRLAATSVLPTAGGSNPTMMLFLLAFRCVDQVIRELS